MDNTRFHQNFILCQILMVINVVAQLYAISVTFHASRFDGLSRDLKNSLIRFVVKQFYMCCKRGVLLM